MTDIAYNNAVDQYADGVYRFIVKNIQHEEDARDIVQTAFEKLWINRDTVDPVKVKSYLFTIAYHQMIDHIRKVKKYTVTDIYETSSIDPVYQPQHELRQTILKDYEGYKYQEIGEIMNLSESQVKVYIHRARLQLKEKLSHLQKASA